MSPVVRLLGAPAIGADEPSLQPLERKDAALLARLVIAGAQPRDLLATLLWPEASHKTATGSLRQRIFRLRRRVDHELLRAGERLELLPSVRCDLQTAAIDSVGELLAGCEYADCPELDGWVQAQREARRAARVEALAAAAARHEAAGELAAALDRAQALLAADPMSEHALRRVMRLHYLRADRSAAITAFERFELRLKEELGTRPDLETVQLLSTIERAQPLPAPRRAQVPASLKRPPRLVGRERERLAMHAAWGGERMYLLLGEAGMGKTRLLAELAASVGAGQCVFVTARPGDAGVPFAVLARLLRALRERTEAAADEATRRELARVLPELGGASALAGEAQRLLLQRAVEWQLLAAQDAGVAYLLLDDLHFADAASLETLQTVLPSERLGTLHVGLAQRPGEGGRAAGALQEALTDTQRLQTISLLPLDASAMTELIESLDLPGLDASALAPALVRHTGGNPMFALETLKDLVLQGATGATLPQPASVGALIERRLRLLSARALALARVAAIAGGDFGIELAESVLHTPALDLADAWSELQAAQVLNGAAFAHDLVADAVARSVPEEIARRVHGAVAEYLETTGRDPAAVAMHWQRAGRMGAAAGAWQQASQRAADAGRATEALAFAQHAADGHVALGQPERAFDALFQARRLAISALDSDGLQQWALRLEQVAATPLQRAQALAVRAHHAAQVQDVVAAEALAHQAQRLARALGDVATVVHAGRSHALALVEQGRDAEALAALQAVTDDGLERLDEREAADLRSDHAFLLSRCGQCRRAVEEYDLALAAASRQQSWQTAQIALSNSAMVCVMLGRLPEALERHERAMALPVEVGSDSLGASMDETTRGAMLIELGRLGEALEVLLRVVPVIQRADHGHWALQAVSNLAHLWLLLGQPARAQQLVAAAERELTQAPPLLMATQQLRLARLLGRGSAERLEALRRLRAERTPPLRQRLVVDIELAQALPPPERAVRLAGVAADAAAMEYHAYALGAQARRIPALLAMGEDAQAADLAEQVHGQADGVWPFDLYLPALWLDMHEAWQRVGRAAPARSVLDRALDWIDRAVQTLPEAMRESFLLRNPTNRELRARASRR